MPVKLFKVSSMNMRVRRLSIWELGGWKDGSENQQRFFVLFGEKFVYQLAQDFDKNKV